MITNKGCKKLRDLEKKISSGGVEGGFLRLNILLVEETNDSGTKASAKYHTYRFDKTAKEIIAASDSGVYIFATLKLADPLLQYRSVIPLTDIMIYLDPDTGEASNSFEFRLNSNDDMVFSCEGIDNYPTCLTNYI